MSAGQPSEVDLDLLADYVGGALDGTDQEAAVARLIAEDAAWAQAHAWLARSTGAVRDVLAEWGAVAAPMPADVVGRLTAALTAAATAHGTGDPAAAQTGEGTARVTAQPDVPAGRRVDPRVDVPRRSDRPERGSRPPRRRDGGAPPVTGRTRGPTAGSRMPRWATAVAVVAAVVAFAGLGVTYLSGDNRADVNSTAADDLGHREGDAAATTPPRPMAGPPTVRLLATGTDYTRTSLAGQVNALRSGDRATAKKSDMYAPETAGGASSPGPNAATDQDGIVACLTAIAAEHGRGVLRVEWVDSATFEGRPALVVVFADRTGERWAWVASPDCGQPQVGAATRYTARVG